MTTLTFSEVMNNGTHLKRRSLAVYSVYYTNCSGARRVTLTHCSRTALNAEEIKHLPSTSSKQVAQKALFTWIPTARGICMIFES